MDKIKCVLFDCWGTCITYSVKDPLFAAKTLLEHCDKDTKATPEEVANYWNQMMKEYYSTMHTFESTIESLINGLIMAFNLKPLIPLPRIVDLSYASQYNPAKVPGLDKVWDYLRAHDIKFGVCSNTVFTSMQTKRQLENVWGDSPDFVLASSEIGVKKPNKHFFEICARKAGFEPQDCAYIGDYFFADVYGSYKAGYGCSIWLNYDKKEPDAELIKGGVNYTECESYEKVLDFLKERI